jgi:hypothetical protein
MALLPREAPASHSPPTGSNGRAFWQDMSVASARPLRGSERDMAKRRPFAPGRDHNVRTSYYLKVKSGPRAVRPADDLYDPSSLRRHRGVQVFDVGAYLTCEEAALLEVRDTSPAVECNFSRQGMDTVRRAVVRASMGWFPLSLRRCGGWRQTSGAVSRRLITPVSSWSGNNSPRPRGEASCRKFSRRRAAAISHSV